MTVCTTYPLKTYKCYYFHHQKTTRVNLEIVNVDYNKPLFMYVHYFPYINFTYDISNYLLRIAFKSVENQIFFNDGLSRK